MSSLVTPNPATQTIEGDLAESWDVAEDGSSYTFHLRDGVTWHDGEPFTANDVAYTFTMAVHPESGTSLAGRLALIKGAAAFTAGEAEELAGITVVDDRTITFEMEFPNGLFVNECVLPILPAHILEGVAPAEIAIQPQVTNSPIGTGPFKLVEYAADQYVEVEANPDYYMEPPGINRIVFNIITSPDTLQIAMGREEVDLPSFDGGTATAALFEEFIADDRFRIDATAGSAVVGYGWNFRHDYLTDPRIHQAFLHAVDRQALIDAFNSGNGTIYNSFMTHAWYQKPEWADLYPFDPEKAKALLAEAGWDSSRTVDVNVITLANDDIRAMVAAEQQMLADVGFNIQFQEMEVATWVERFYQTHEFELVRVTFGVFPDPDGFLNFHMKSTSQNAFGYASPELDARIDEGRKLINQEDRVPIYQALNEEMLETLPVCPLYMQNTWWVRNKKWGVPLLDALPLATDLASIPIHPIMLGGDDVWRYNPEEWTKE
jgi:peptide/nickel transport system substrate-binding protein